MKNQPLVVILTERQKLERLTDKAFAEKLQVSRRLWGRTRDGEIPLGMRLIKATLQTYPDLANEVLNFLRDGSGNGNRI